MPWLQQPEHGLMGPAGCVASKMVLQNERSTRCAATARGVGCSKINVGGSPKPVSDRSLDASSVAARESIPASMSGVSEATIAPCMPVSSCTTLRTSPSMQAWRSSGASNLRRVGSHSCSPSASPGSA
eukprot:6096180-Prymnesium_polylepis.2